MSYYTEKGSFTHDGVRYDIEKAFELARTLPTQRFKVKDLKWVLAYDTPDPERVSRADLSAPILVALDKTGRLTVIDGLHRLTKAVQEGHTRIMGKYIEPSKLQLLRI